MGVSTFNDVFTSPIAAARNFKASIVDSHNLVPKLVPHVKSIDFIKGSGGAGTIQHVTFADGSTLKYHIDELNEEKLIYKYTLIEGEALKKDVIEKITYDVKYESSPDGGCISKVSSNYYTKGDIKLTEEDIKAGKEKLVAVYKAVETYLVQNPDAYAA